ncbi:hypothetical protein SAMN05216417_102204 [Nitrosospira multiformis]|uniref:Uncharacterized protein n=1 Tax=Nitrosospira multiformis TaxID=1231 RepID=A0A1I7FU04_9PROT|nr:hypothetical protein SAMN05216417_102204 [Nitrosospira multiformis]
MAKEKPRRTRLSFDKESIDPAVCQVFFNDVCNGDRKRAGELINKFMRQACEERYGPGANRFIESARRYLER